MVRPFRSLQALAYLIPLWLMFSPASAQAQISIMGRQFLCPSTSFCVAGPPKLKFKRVCPKPVCNPCTYENYGYYPTCWTPWLKEVDYSHCPCPPAAGLVLNYQTREAAVEEQPAEPVPPPSQPKPKPDKEVPPEGR